MKEIMIPKAQSIVFIFWSTRKGKERKTTTPKEKTRKKKTNEKMKEM